jgi:iron complex outermembrane receptor protein
MSPLPKWQRVITTMKRGEIRMRLQVVAAVVGLSIVGWSAASDVKAAFREPTVIPAQSLETALKALSAKRNIQFVYVSEEVGARRTQGATGDLTADEALRQLLAGTGLVHRYLNDATIAIEPVQAAPQGSVGQPPSPSPGSGTAAGENHAIEGGGESAVLPLRLAQNGTSTSSSTSEAKEQSSQLEEVLVTATKRSESIMDVPLSISALSSDDLEALRAQRVQDFAFSVPNLSFATNGVGGGAIVLRGTNIAGGQFSPIAITVDDASFGGIDMRPILETQVFDVERIEVLRGPQGSLTGSSSLGGTINIVTAKPDPTAFTFKGTLDYGRYGSALVKAVANVPVGDAAALRMVAYRDSSDGAVENVGPGGKSSSRENIGGRIATLWNVSDELEVGAAISYEDLRYGIDTALYLDRFWGGDAVAAANRARLGELGGTYYDPAVDFVQPNGVDGGSVMQDIAEDIPVTNLLGSAYAKYDFGGATLQFLYGHFEHSLEGVNDVDLSEFAGLLAGYEWDSRSDALELRLTSSNEGPLNWVAGLTYGEEKMPQAGSVDLGDNQYAGSYSFYFDWASLRAIETQAAFGNLFWDVAPRTHLSAGVRFSRVKSAYGNSSVSVAGAPFPEMELITGTVDRFDPRVAISFDLTDRTMLYAQYATGFRPGYGNNPILAGVRDTTGGTLTVPRTVDNEYASNYEVGFKGTMFDGRASLAAAFFHMDYEDLQVRGPDLTDPVLGQFSYDINAGSGQSRGFELEWAAKLTPAFQMNAGVGYVDAEVENIPGLAGRYEAPGTRPWMANLSGEYARDLTEAYRGRLRFDYRWQEQAYQYLASEDPATELPQFGVLNLSTGVATSRWDLLAYVDNVTDENYWVGVAYGGLRGTKVGFIPRTYGLRFTYNFMEDR